jgi:hypothetical protein
MSTTQSPKDTKASSCRVKPSKETMMTVKMANLTLKLTDLTVLKQSKTRAMHTTINLAMKSGCHNSEGKAEPNNILKTTKRINPDTLNFLCLEINTALITLLSKL